jgi:NADH dehydrogenase
VLARLVRLSPVVYPLPGGGTARFQPVYVDDIARAIGVALDRPDTQGESFGLGGPDVLTLRQMVRRVLVAMETKRLLIGVPVSLIRPLIAVAQRILPNPPVTTSLLELLDIDNTISGPAAWPGLEISPTPFTPRHLAYLKEIDAREAMRTMMGRSSE